MGWGHCPVTQGSVSNFYWRSANYKLSSSFLVFQNVTYLIKSHNALNLTDCNTIFSFLHSFTHSQQIFAFVYKLSEFSKDEINSFGIWRRFCPLRFKEEWSGCWGCCLLLILASSSHLLPAILSLRNISRIVLCRSDGVDRIKKKCNRVSREVNPTRSSKFTVS